MRRLAAIPVFVLVAACLAAAQAASPEQDYLAARDGYIARFKARDVPGKTDDALLADETKALGDLEGRLRGIVGTVSVPGFGAANGNLETLLSGDMGFGTLDAVAMATPDGKSRVIVTTVPLFKAWLRAHRRWWGKKFADMPQDIAAAIRTEAFYTQATQSGAAMVAYGELPVKRPDGATLAFAVLAARTQDQSPPAPDRMFVVLAMKDRVYVSEAPLAERTAPDPACAALRARFDKRGQAAFDAYRAGGLKDASQFDRYTDLQKQGDEAQRRCFAGKMPVAARAQAIRQAQSIIVALVGL